MKNTLTDKIRLAVKQRVRLTITTASRSATGFIIVYPNGGFSSYPSKEIALQALYASVRCHARSHWRLIKNPRPANPQNQP